MPGESHNRNSRDERLRDLRRRFTQPEKSTPRTPAKYGLGSIYWVVREGWKGCGGFYDNKSRDAHPGLVTTDQHVADGRLEVVPGTSSPEAQEIRNVICQQFIPDDPFKLGTDIGERPEHQYFILNYFRPVPLRHFGHLMGLLTEKDRKRLVIEMHAARKIEDMIRKLDRELTEGDVDAD